jgi:hypothetical protein
VDAANGDSSLISVANYNNREDNGWESMMTVV